MEDRNKLDMNGFLEKLEQLEFKEVGFFIQLSNNKKFIVMTEETFEYLMKKYKIEETED